jgi:hypothetical protein
MIYEIRVQEVLDTARAAWFDTAQLIHADGTTVIRCKVRDQSELHGMLSKIRDLNLTLLAVTLIGADKPKQNG